jgi:hypothetical protein
MVGHQESEQLEPPACPECGAQNTVPVMYGYPSQETFEAVERGEIPWVAIGGCVLDESNPFWGCPICQHRW